MLTIWQARYIVAAMALVAATRLAGKEEPTASRILVLVSLFHFILTNFKARRAANSATRRGQINLRGKTTIDGQMRRREACDAPGVFEDPPFRSPDRPGQVLLASDRHALILAELRREALELGPRRR